MKSILFALLGLLLLLSGCEKTMPVPVIPAPASVAPSAPAVPSVPVVAPSAPVDASVPPSAPVEPTATPSGIVSGAPVVEGAKPVTP